MLGWKKHKLESRLLYIIDITENKIAIVGTTDEATQRAVKLFISNYVNESSKGVSINIRAGKTVMQRYYSENVTFINGNSGAEWEVGNRVVLSEANGISNKYGEIMNVSSNHYPSITELRYQPNKEDNGKLIAHFCLRDGFSDTDACFMESSDGGKTWSLLSRPKEQSKAGINASLKPGQMAHIYELPAQLGEYPAGTLVYASGSINYSIRSEIWMWYSTDCGKTWKQTAKIAIGGAVNPVPGWHEQSGVWEPFVWYEDGYLYCFYSDDSDKNHDQKLVYKRSKDGVNWSKLVDVCTFDDPDARPGMFVMTKMGNGEYFMVYEYVNDPDKPHAPVYYKTTKDITEWNPADKGTLIEDSKGAYPGSAPSCVWTPYGGECGTLVVTASSTREKIFVSFDYGKTWEQIESPLAYKSNNIDDSTGKPSYSAGLWLSKDMRTIYFINTTTVDKKNDPDSKVCAIEFTTIKIYD